VTFSLVPTLAGHLPFLGTLKSSQKAAQGKPQTEDEEDKTLKEIGKINKMTLRLTLELMCVFY
jgi:hypothetical protein